MSEGLHVGQTVIYVGQNQHRTGKVARISRKRRNSGGGVMEADMAFVRWDGYHRSSWVDLGNLSPLGEDVGGIQDPPVDYRNPDSLPVEVLDYGVGDRIRFHGEICRIGRMSTFDGRLRARLDWIGGPLRSHSWIDVEDLATAQLIVAGSGNIEVPRGDRIGVQIQGGKVEKESFQEAPIPRERSPEYHGIPMLRPSDEDRFLEVLRAEDV